MVVWEAGTPKGARMLPVGQLWAHLRESRCGSDLVQEGHLDRQRAAGHARLLWLWEKYSEPEGSGYLQLGNCTWATPAHVGGQRKVSEALTQTPTRERVSLEHLPAPESKKPTHGRTNPTLIILCLVSPGPQVTPNPAGVRNKVSQLEGLGRNRTLDNERKTHSPAANFPPGRGETHQ